MNTLNQTKDGATIMAQNRKQKANGAFWDMLGNIWSGMSSNRQSANQNNTAAVTALSEALTAQNEAKQKTTLYIVIGVVAIAAVLIAVKVIKK